MPQGLMQATHQPFRQFLVVDVNGQLLIDRWPVTSFTSFLHNSWLWRSHTQRLMKPSSTKLGSSNSKQ